MLGCITALISIAEPVGLDIYSQEKFDAAINSLKILYKQVKREFPFPTNKINVNQVEEPH